MAGQHQAMPRCPPSRAARGGQPVTIQDYLRVLREQWLVVLLAVLLGLGGAAAAFFLRPAEYTAKLTMYVSSQGGDSTTARPTRAPSSARSGSPRTSSW